MNLAAAAWELAAPHNQFCSLSRVPTEKGHHVEAENLLDGHTHLGQSRNISIVSGEKCLQDCQSGFIGCCSRKLEDGYGVRFGIISMSFSR